MQLQTPKKQTGFTLVETVVVIGVYTILILAITSSIASLYKTNSYALGQQMKLIMRVAG